MRKLAKSESKVRRIDALLALYKTCYMADDVYLIDRDVESNTPGVTLWMSGFDYLRLVIIANGSKVSVHEVEGNTKSYRDRGDYPKGTKEFKYVSIS